MARFHKEYHRSERIGWLRAAVLGANDGVISVASLVVGIAAAGAAQGTIFITGMAGLVAGMMSMAAGEYVSVRSQADIETAEMNKEKAELADQPELELQELTAIYMERGLSEPLAHQVATELTAHDALGVHAREELGITETLRARPLQAAVASALAFAAGAIVPILATVIAPEQWITQTTFATAILTLFALGATAAAAGGAPVIRGAVRVTFWGVAAMVLTAIIGHLFGAAV